MTGPETGHASRPLPEGGTIAGVADLLLGLADPGGERRALLLERLDLLQRRVAILVDRSERRGLLALRRDERVAARDESRDDAALLGSRGIDRRLDARRLRPCEAGAPASVRHSVTRRLDLRGDALVLTADPPEQLEVVEDVGEARRADHEREHVRPVGHVQLAHPPLEARESDAVLAAEALQAGRLVGDGAVERREAGPGAGELALEHREASLLRVDPCLQLAHAPRHGAQLLGDDAGLTLRVRHVAAETAELAVDARLLGAGIAGRGAGREEETESQESCDGRFRAGSTTHQALFALSARVPSARATFIRSSARSASAASRRSTPTTAR